MHTGIAYIYTYLESHTLLLKLTITVSQVLLQYGMVFPFSNMPDLHIGDQHI